MDKDIAPTLLSLEEPSLMTWAEESSPEGPEQLSCCKQSFKDMGTCCVLGSPCIAKAKAVLQHLLSLLVGQGSVAHSSVLLFPPKT